MKNKLKYNRKTLVISLALIMVSSIFVVTPPIVADNGTYDYVIITTNGIVYNSEELDHFIHMKEINGHSVKVVTESDFGGLICQNPNDRADKIRKWLKDNYQGLGIEYVLLIGDPDPDDTKNPSDHIGGIPMKMCWPRYFRGGTGAPTDLYFADLNSNWDLDGDGFYHEGKDYYSPKSPDPSIEEDTFSVFWTGEVMCDHSVDYTFKILSDDGVQLLIDGVVVIDNWVEHVLMFDEWTGAMTAGKHDISIKFRENYGDGIIKLYWRTEVPKTDPCYIGNQIIPSDHLYDADGNVGNLTGFYYNNNDLTGWELTRLDPEIDFEWGTGDYGIYNPDYEVEVYVGRIPVYDDDYEQLDKILRKIIDYETDPGDISWRESILLPMARMDSITSSAGLGEAIKTDIADPKGFYSYRIYEQDFNPPTPDLWPCEFETVWNEWKNDYGMVTWHTHGGEEHAAHIIHRNNLSNLDDSKPAFTFQAACHTGYPENKNNLAYSLLKHGGVALIAGSRMTTYGKGEYTSFDPSKYMYHQMAYFYTKHIITSGMPAGKAYAQVVYDHSQPNANAIEFNLYGDPECYLLTTFGNEFPIADVNGPYTGYEGSVISFDAIGSSDPEGDTLDYRWDFDNDGTWETDWSTSPTAEYTWGDDYSGTVKLEIRDEIGKTTIATTTVTVYNVVPTTTFDTLGQPNPQFILPYQELNYEGSFTDPGWQDIHTAEWNYGDGTIEPGNLTEENDEPLSTGEITGEHSYSNPGTYIVTLTVTDDDWGSGTDTMVIEVVDALEALEDLNGYIQNLPDSAFKKNPNQMKNALHNKISSIYKMVEKQKYNSAINKLINDIRKKADGHIDGKLKDDWIIDSDAQYHICMKIDDITEYLATFL